MAFSLLAATSSAWADSGLSFGESQDFNGGWKFALGVDSTVNATPEFDDSAWRSLQLPHDWSIEQLPSPSLNACTGFFPGGIGWYRKHFNASASPDSVTYIYFEGVYNRSEVYLNGRLIGKRPNGYVSFYYDITPFLRQGDNVMAVRVDHSREAASRWYTGSGIYRDVKLVKAPATHFAPWGVGWKARKVSTGRAMLEVDYAVEGPGASEGHSVVATLRDSAGKVVATSEKKNAGASGVLTMKVNRPELWNLDSPSLYTLELTLGDAAGRVMDRSECRVGFRTLEFSPDKGFALNGKNTKVKGVCLHHDAGVLGSVVPESVWRHRLQALKEIGVNAIRMSHNPQSPVVYDICDELGLLVMDEASDEWEFPKRKWVTGWNVGTPKFEGSYDFFNEWIERDVADMVRRDRNHPSVAFWSIGNEVDYPNDPYSHPVLDEATINQHNYGGYDPSAPSAMRIGEIAQRLAPIVRSIDDSRPVTGALAGVVMSNETAYPEAVDIVGYNYTENRYESDHKKYPRRVIYGSENSHGFDEWRAVRDNDYIFGQFLWTGADYLGESLEWPSRGLGTGLLDFGDFLKTRGKFRASLWSETPVAYLAAWPRPENASDSDYWIDAPAHWNYDEEGQMMRVECFTNAASAALSLNGEQIGVLRHSDADRGAIVWDLPYTPGVLTVNAYDDKGRIVATDTLATTGRPYALKVAEEPDFQRGDVARIVIEVVDEEGRRVDLADNLVKCEIEGNIVLLGLEGTGNVDMSHPKAESRRVGNGRLVAYITRGGEGCGRLKFSSPLLRARSLKFRGRRGGDF
ncbi:MAG: DUF4982 domain-containing protein [Muribaculaceae bacterium]|nr:DUF4982 domain-containing protein [Muribaculaceae bacterium]